MGSPGLLEAAAAGRLEFASGVSPLLLAPAALAVVAGVWLLHRRTARPLSAGWKAFFVGIRSAALLLLLFCLLRPVVSATRISPLETYLGIVTDDSMSMGIADMPGGRSRSAAVAAVLGEGGVLEELSRTFRLRHFRFDGSAERAAGLDGLRADGAASSIDRALAYADAQLGGMPLAGIVLVTDGADNGRADPVARARELGARRIPVFTVGAGREEIPRDIGIADVAAARSVLEGSVFTVRAALEHQGYEGRRVELSVLDGGEVAAAETVTLGAPGIPRRIELELTPSRPEAIVYELRVEPQRGEIIAENNSRRFLVDNTEKPPLDVLYIEGHPRNEYKFIRRAVEGDASLRLATYLQTGPEKYYRQGIASPTELSGGFPDDREALYRYEALLLGDVGADFFTPGQLSMIEAFVAERGGGLLTSGVIDEGFIGTPLADVLPVAPAPEGLLPGRLRGGIRRGDHPAGGLYRPRMTVAGERSPLLRLAGDEGENRARWGRLPPLQGIHVTGGIKPGATVLAEHPELRHRGRPLPVLASQRYGRGRSMSLAAASTWRWQMMMPAADRTHETVWRQLLRWLASAAPERVTVAFDREFYHVGDEAVVTATVLDGAYEPDSDATVWMQVTDPRGGVTDRPMEWDLAEDGVYRAVFEVEREGAHGLLVDVAGAAGGAGGALEKRAAFAATPSLREYAGAGMDRGLLRRIAEASGGRHLDLDEAPRLAGLIASAPGAHSRLVRIDLWDRPWLLALLLALLCADWTARRMKGLS